MKIILIGASGDIGRAAQQELASRHTVVAASRKAVPPDAVDLCCATSLARLMAQHEGADALVITGGEPHFGPLARMSAAQFRQGLEGKLMGQVEAALLAQRHLAERGSITLTSGVIGDVAVRYGVCAAAVNGAIEGFVRSAAAELPRGLRINVVSPGLMASSVERIGPYFRGFDPIPAERIGRAYALAVEGIETGQVYRVR